MKQRVYVDTSVIGSCCDDEFAVWSKALFEEFREGMKVAVVSDLTFLELKEAPTAVRNVLKAVPERALEAVALGEEALALADRYVEEGVVTEGNITDARHIDIASVERVDVLASWNFKHIVNLRRIHAFNAVNLKQGYPVLEIRSPREVLDEKEL